MNSLYEGTLSDTTSCGIPCLAKIDYGSLLKRTAHSTYLSQCTWSNNRQELNRLMSSSGINQWLLSAKESLAAL